MSSFHHSLSTSSAAIGTARLPLRVSGVIAAVFCFSVFGAGAGLEQSDSDRAVLLRSLPRMSALPPGFDNVTTLTRRGAFYAVDGVASSRKDDGDARHGADSLPVWARSTKGEPTQGVLYGVEEGVIVSAGYLVRQVDLVGGKSFRNLSLRGLDFPAPQHLTVDFIAGQTADANQYLWLWHFLPREEGVSPPLALGVLPPVTSLPPRFSAYACEQYPNAFCPRMGRHHTDLSKSTTRPPAATRDDGVIYGEAAGKLIFIEYVFSQGDLAAGASWPGMALNGVPIPPVDNLHLLHYNGADGAPGRYTAHMYFVPEQIYLSWDSEPPRL